MALRRRQQDELQLAGIKVFLFAFWLVQAGGYSPAMLSQQSHGQEMDRLVAEATAAKDRHMDKLFKLPAVVGGGVGTSKKHPDKAVIQIFVSRRLKNRERKLFPARLEGIPVEIVITGTFRSLKR